MELPLVQQCGGCWCAPLVRRPPSVICAAGANDSSLGEGAISVLSFVGARPSFAASSGTDLRSVPPSPKGKAMATGCAATKNDAHSCVISIFIDILRATTPTRTSSSSVTNKQAATPAWSLGQGPRLRESTACTRDRYSLCVTLFALAAPITPHARLAGRYPRCPKSFEGGLGGTFPQKSSPQRLPYFSISSVAAIFVSMPGAMEASAEATLPSPVLRALRTFSRVL